MSTTKYIVNNVTGQTIDGNLTINGDLVITGTTNTRPYKVYTALLTQSGGDGPNILTSGDLTIGVTYLISDNGGSEWDFTNVGAPNNNVGTYFVATDTTPNSWGVESALSYNTGAPVVTVLENTIGNIWFSYENAGYYRVNSSDLFTQNKTTYFITNTNTNDLTFSFLTPNGIPNSIDIQTSNTLTTFTDGLMFNTPIEIRVYN